MTWANASRLLQVTDGIITTQQINRISRDLQHFENKDVFLSILDVDNLKPNNIGLAKAKKWIAKIFGLYDEDVEGMMYAHNDLGEAVYYLQDTKESEGERTLNTILRLLELDCGKMDSTSFDAIETELLRMSSNERRWFIRYWLRIPRNNINSGIVAKIIAKHFDKPQKEVKKHLNYNSVSLVCQCYMNGLLPTTNIVHGNFIAPMLAKEIPMNKWKQGSIVDYKYDGNRYQIHIQDKNVIIFNRKGNVVTNQFPDIVSIVQEYDVKNAVLDGEIYPINENGFPIAHKHMATRVHSKDINEALEKVSVKWVIFDALKINDETIMDFSYRVRLERIKNLPNQAERYEGTDIMGFYSQAIANGFEGIIVKDADAPYESGKRSVSWAKYKPPQINLDVVILSAKYGEGKRANVFGTFGIGVKANNGFYSVGSVGTGFSDSDLVSLTKLLRTKIENVQEGVYQFSPSVILEVKADLVSRDEKGNLGLRFPRCIRIRDDKFITDINTLEDVERLE